MATAAQVHANRENARKSTGPVTDAYGNERIALRLETVVDRTEFGIGWNAPLPGGGFALSNDVKLKADLTLVKAA